MKSARTSADSYAALTDSELFRLATAEVYSISPKLWLASVHHRSSRNQVMSFIPDRTWQLTMLRDNSPEIVCMKASQIGVTEIFGLLEMISQAMQGRAGGYILPTDRIVYEFTPRRIDKTIQRVPYYAAHCALGFKDSNTKSQKTLFGTDWNIVGSNVATNLFEKPWDGYIVDENDKCVQANLGFAKDRIASATNPFVRRFGNPTIASFGISALYEASDKKAWLVKCPQGHEQPLTWFDNVVSQIGDKQFEPYRVDDGVVQVVCRECHEPLDRLQWGRWVAEYPDRRVSGYQVSQLFGDPRRDVNGVETISLMFEDFIAALNNPTESQRFYNNKLGVPFEAPGTKIDDQVLAKCVDHEWRLPVTAEGTVGGVDIGLGLHCWFDKIVNGRAKQVWAGVVGSYDELDALCRRFGTVVGCMDAGPEIHAPREFVRSHAGWFLVRYNLNDKMRQGGVSSDDWKVVDYKAASISVNRTESIDRMLQNFLMGMVILPPDYMAIANGDMVKHLKVPTRVREDRPDGTFRYIWTKGEDHLFHAKNYANIAGSMIMGSAVL